MFTGIAIIASLLLFEAQTTVVLDRIAVVVSKRVIKTSDIDRDLRVTTFLNRAPLTTKPDDKRKAAERLIDQQIIRQEIATGAYPRASDEEADTLMSQIRRDRFAGTESRMRTELSRYGLTQAQLHDQLLWQLTVLRFINERFRPAVMVSDEDVRKYYDEHLPELKRQYPRDSSFETLAPRIREALEGEQTNKQFETWIEAARKRNVIEFHQEAFQ